mmetsp:Transcript_27622/g.85324  ORF Transcript_27622/g.85324 Transcript_27622/m.85324 type:complete len:224 (-) Transcript_27622:1181-1852(-)
MGGRRALVLAHFLYAFGDASPRRSVHYVRSLGKRCHQASYDESTACMRGRVLRALGACCTPRCIVGERLRAGWALSNNHGAGGVGGVCEATREAASPRLGLGQSARRPVVNRRLRHHHDRRCRRPRVRGLVHVPRREGPDGSRPALEHRRAGAAPRRGGAARVSLRALRPRFSRPRRGPGVPIHLSELRGREQRLAPTSQHQPRNTASLAPPAPSSSHWHRQA